MKKNIALFLAFLMIISALTACTQAPAKDTSVISTGQATSSSNTTQQAPVTITCWDYPRYEGYEDFRDAYDAAVMKKYPWITVETEILSWDAGPEKLTVAMGTGTTPDLYLDGYSRIAPAITAGLAADVTDLVEELVPMVLEGSQKSGVIDGRHYFANLWLSTAYNVVVNTTLAKELGVYDMLPSDRLHWTYDDFLKISRAVTAADNSKYAVALFAGSRSSDAWYYSWLLSGGTPITNDDKTAAVVNTPEAAATLNVFKTIVEEGLCPAGAATSKDQDVGVFFNSGAALFNSDAGVGNLVSLQSRMDNGELEPFEYVIYSIPTPDGRDPKPATWGDNGWVIFKNNSDEAKLDAAKKTVKLLYEEKDLATELANRASYSLVINGVDVTYPTEHLTELGTWSKEYTVQYSTSDFGILEGWWSNFRETFYVELQGVYSGSQTVDQALANWEKAANGVISAAQ